MSSKKKAAASIVKMVSTANTGKRNKKKEKKKRKSAKNNTRRALTRCFADLICLGFFYTTRKSRLLGRKLLLNKYDPVLRRHVLFKEEKISRTKR
jgi:ribosomal protein L33